MENLKKEQTNILYGAPPIRKRENLLVLLGRLNLPFVPKEILASEERVLLLGELGEVLLLDPEKQTEVSYPLPPEYNVSPTLCGQEIAAISSRDGFVAFSRNESYQILETADRRLIFKSGPGAQMQLTSEGLLLFEPEARKILFHNFYKKAENSLFTEVVEDALGFYPGQNGTLYRTSDGVLGHLDDCLESHNLGVAASDHLLFAQGDSGVFYIVNNKELLSYDPKEERWEVFTKLGREPRLLTSWQNKALLFYPGGQLEVFSGEEKIISASLPPQTTSLALASGLLITAQGSEALFWSVNI